MLNIEKNSNSKFTEVFLWDPVSLIASKYIIDEYEALTLNNEQIYIFKCEKSFYDFHKCNFFNIKKQQYNLLLNIIVD